MNDTERLREIQNYCRKHYGDNGISDEYEEELASRVKALLDEARLHERKEIALDNYQGHTFSESTDWQGKFEKFIKNNERRIATLTQRKGNVIDGLR